MSSKNIDGGWAWVILSSAFCSYILNGFLCFSMGIITEAMLEVFDGDLSLTSAVGSAVVGAQCCIGPLAGLLSKRFGCRSCSILGGIIALIGLVGASVSRDLYTVLICGVVTGIGYGFNLTVGGVVIGLYFHRLRPLAAGVAMTGAGIGMFVGPPFVRFLIDQYDLHGMFLILAGISSHFCVLGSLMRPLPKREEVQEKRNVKVQRNRRYSFRSLEILCKRMTSCGSCACHIWKNVGFVIYLCSIFLWAAAESACLLHLPNYCIQQGSSRTETAFLFTPMGIGNMCSRLLTGFAANEEGANHIIIHAGQLGLASLFTVFFPFYSGSYGGQMAYSVALGIYTSGVNSLYNPLTVRLVGLENFAIGFGLVNLSAGLGYLAGSPIAGAIVDLGGTYTDSYIFAGLVYLASSLSAMLIPIFHKATDDYAIPELKNTTILIENVDYELSNVASMTDTFDNQDSKKMGQPECELDPLK